MLSIRRIKQWIEALRMAGVTRVPWWGMVTALLSGPAPREVWRRRMRTCMTCPLYSRPSGVPLCRSTHPQMLGVGCGCYLPFKALAAAPYPAGCFGRGLDEEIGWPVHSDNRRWWRRILDFVRGK